MRSQRRLRCVGSAGTTTWPVPPCFSPAEPGPISPAPSFRWMEVLRQPPPVRRNRPASQPQSWRDSQYLPQTAARTYGSGMATADLRHDIREFLSSRRARVTPQDAGLPAYGSNRRVTGLRREEVALLAGISVD